MLLEHYFFPLRIFQELILLLFFIRKKAPLYILDGFQIALLFFKLFKLCLFLFKRCHVFMKTSQVILNFCLHLFDAGERCKKFGKGYFFKKYGDNTLVVICIESEETRAERFSRLFNPRLKNPDFRFFFSYLKPGLLYREVKPPNFNLLLFYLALD